MEWEEAITFHNLGNVVLRATLSHFHPNFSVCEQIPPLKVPAAPRDPKSRVQAVAGHNFTVGCWRPLPGPGLCSMGMWEPFPHPRAAAWAEKAGEGIEKERKII